MDISENIANKLDFNSWTYQGILHKLGQIDTFRGTWKAIEQSKSQYLKELRKIATIESIGSSTRIEGAALTDAEVEKLLKSVKISKLETRDEQEVIGYYEALQVILDNYNEITLSERYIHQLHGILLKFSNKDQSHKGGYKTLSNQVVANYPDGVQRIIFRTTEPHLTSSEMEQLISWTSERLKSDDMHPLMIVAVFVYEFLSIHPYQDGNGRLSRLLTTLILMKLDYAFIQYVSFEHVIEAKKDEYYRALMTGQKNRYKPEERIDLWINFFLDSLIELTRKLDAKYETFQKFKVVLNDRQQAIINCFKDGESIQISDLEKSLPDFSRNTLKKDLIHLVNEGFLVKMGSGRGVRYFKKKSE